MKKHLFLITALLILGITISTALAVPFPNPKLNPNNEPVDKVTFIHYK